MHTLMAFFFLFLCMPPSAFGSFNQESHDDLTLKKFESFAEIHDAHYPSLIKAFALEEVFKLSEESDDPSQKKECYKTPLFAQKEEIYIHPHHAHVVKKALKGLPVFSDAPIISNMFCYNLRIQRDLPLQDININNGLAKEGFIKSQSMDFNDAFYQEGPLNKVYTTYYASSYGIMSRENRGQRHFYDQKKPALPLMQRPLGSQDGQGGQKAPKRRVFLDKDYS